MKKKNQISNESTINIDITKKKHKKKIKYILCYRSINFFNSEQVLVESNFVKYDYVLDVNLLCFRFK
jgi:hypothetical protein